MEIFNIQFGGVPWNRAPYITKQYKDLKTAIKVCNRLSNISGIVIRLKKKNSLEAHYIKPDNYIYQKEI